MVAMFAPPFQEFETNEIAGSRLRIARKNYAAALTPRCNRPSELLAVPFTIPQPRPTLAQDCSMPAQACVMLSCSRVASTDDRSTDDCSLLNASVETKK
jgi:hypothetical protein